MTIMGSIRRLFSKTNTYHRLSEKSSLLTFGNLANSDKMSTSNPDQPKKSSSFVEKLGQRISTIKDDIADNIERRKQLYNNPINNQVHFITRTNQTEDSLVIEKRPPTPPEPHHHSSGDDGSISERSFSISQFTAAFGKKLAPETSTASSTTTGIVHSHSNQDIFSSENSVHAKDMIMNNVRSEINRSRAVSESGSDDFTINKIDHVGTTTVKTEKNQRKSTMLLAGPKFRCHTIEPEYNLKRDTIYPISIGVGILSIIIIFWQPISSFLSGYFLGFLSAGAIAYIIIQTYLTAKIDERIEHEWIDFPELESILQEKVTKEDKHTSLNTCCEVVFGRYDTDRDNEFIRYPAVIRLDNYHLIIQLPAKIKGEEKKDKEIKFVGFREYLIKETKLILVPEASLNRIKYWLNEYPIVLENIEILNKQITNKQYYEKPKIDIEDFFNNSRTTLSLFFETGPDKEDWFHKLSLVLRDDNRFLPTQPLNRIARSVSDTQIPTLGTRATQMQSNTVNLENRIQMKAAETVGPPYADTIAIDKSETEALRSQINEGDILSDMTQARIGAQEIRKDSFDKDSDKDSTGTNRTASTKKKVRKEEENLYRLLDSPDCLDEAAITLNFLTRRLLCDVFEERFFKDLIKEKIELKLKEIAVSVLDDLHVETIDMGNTFPVILKVEPMQWNTKGIWFNLFLFYRGSFKITIKTRIVLQRLLNYNPISDQPMYYQHHSEQIVHKDDDRIENDELVQRQKLLAKEPEIPENAAARKLGTLLTRVAANKHFQRFAALKPVAGVIEKLSNAEVGVNIELTNFSGIMTINIPPPPSDRIWIGFAEMPDLNLKVTPVFGESRYSYTLIHDFLEARIRDEIKRLLVLPSMDDQLLPFFRDWVIDAIRAIATKSSNKDLNQTTSEEF